MKFRTDFVTNSSDSSFMVFSIKNGHFLDRMEKLGIKIVNKDGTIKNYASVTLPSGAEGHICTDEYQRFPITVSDYVTAWMIASMFEGLDDLLSDFDEELLEVLAEAGLIDEEFAEEEEFSTDDLIAQLEKGLGEEDTYIEEMHYEHVYGFEGDTEFVLYDSIKDGKREKAYIQSDELYELDDEEREEAFDLTYGGDIKEFIDDFGTEYEYQAWDEASRSWVDTEADESADTRKTFAGKTFVITGKLQRFENRDEIVEYITGRRGNVTGSVSSKTDFLICNDPASTSSKMKKAKELGIPVLSEDEFIRRFCNDLEAFGIEIE